MAQYFPVLLLVVLTAMLLVGTFRRGGDERAGAGWWIVVGLVGIVAVARGYQFISEFTLLSLYGGMVVLNYIITFFVAVFLYHDPIKDDRGDAISHYRRWRVHYVVPVFNEEGDLSECINSILASARDARDFVETHITIVDDASTRHTEKLIPFESMPGVEVMRLSRNAGKKGAIAAGTFGGENWRDGFELFRKRYGRRPEMEDHDRLIVCMREVGCNPYHADYDAHTDSDSRISETFIRTVVTIFRTDERIGAISGHCGVWLPEGEKPTWMTMLQVAWYDTQFRIRKAVESFFGTIFCVSGPGAAFLAAAFEHHILEWVDDVFGGGYYRGATDRKATLLVLKDRLRIVYSEMAEVWTVVPSDLNEARRQWTRWKQNFWRMLVPVWQFAWRIHPVPAFLTYSRLIVTILAPFIFAYHLVLALLGDVINSALYLAGIALMGSLFGIAYAVMSPRNWRYAMLRPFMSLLSAFWGSILTLRALMLTIQGTFTWRETGKGRRRKGRFLYRWIDPTFEMRFLEVVLIAAIIIFAVRRWMHILETLKRWFPFLR